MGNARARFRVGTTLPSSRPYLQRYWPGRLTTSRVRVFHHIPTRHLNPQCHTLF